MPHFYNLEFVLSAVFTFCNNALEQGNLDLWQYINVVIIIFYYDYYIFEISVST